MNGRDDVTNVVFAGLGGQGVLKASDILAEAAFRSGFDVKKSEIHGMSQRGGSVTSDVRFGPRVLSPMAPASEADYLVVLETTQVVPNEHVLRAGGVLLVPTDLLEPGESFDDLANNDRIPVRKRTTNVALLGLLSAYLPIDEAAWEAALYANLKEAYHAINLDVFAFGRSLRHGR